MKAISLWQPHASWIAIQWKTIETREHDRFKNLVGKRIAIHAAQKVETAALFYDPFRERMKSGLDWQNFITWMNLCRGKVLCTASVVRGIWAPKSMSSYDYEVWNRRAMCNTAGKYLLFLGDIEPLREAVKCTGRRGIFEVNI